jgi:hypothetical protein
MAYARARNQAKWACRNAVKEHERTIAQQAKQNPKAFYSHVNKKLKTKTSIPDLDKPAGGETSGDQDKAEVMNNFFSSVFTNEDLVNRPNFEKRMIAKPMNPLHITPEMVKDKLTKLKPNKTPGLDNIHPRILLEACEVLSHPLAVLMNKTLKNNEVPQDWKKAIVSPIFKKGSKSTPGNYRPVSLTCVICKINESIIKDHIMKHFVENNLLTNCQHGFVSGKSCNTQLLECMDIWTEIIDNGGYLDVIYLDFAKAFDKVAHQRLISKMEGYGVNNEILKWTECFLTDRKQKVVINGEESSWADVLSGVPQGSVIGPLLFVIYINDLPEEVHTTVKIFADDTKLFTDISRDQMAQELQNDIHRLDKWAEKWQLKFNADKCKVMHIGQKNQQRSYDMKKRGEMIELEKTIMEKDLGVNIDNQLKFSNHIEMQVNKGNKLLGLIRRSFTYLDRNSMLTMYKTLVRPLIEYGHAIIYPRYEKDKKLIEGVQRRATKIIKELKDKEYPDRLNALKLPSLQYRRDRGDMIETYKFTHGNYTSTYPFINDEDNSRRGHSFKLKKGRFYTNVRKHFFSERVVNLWNALPDQIVDAPTINTFKNRLDRHWNKYLYSLDSIPTTRATLL